MKIESLGMSTFFVRLTPEGGLYYIDMDELSGNGFCACRDFECRHLPKLEHQIDKKGEITEFSRCKHIIAVIDYLSKKDGSIHCN
jgi:hypothetical protein